MVTHSKKFCWSSMIIGHLFVLNLFISETSHEEYDAPHFNHKNIKKDIAVVISCVFIFLCFNQLNLNSSFSIGLLIN